MDSMPNGTVRSEVDEGVATVLLDRPDTMNSMNNEFMDDLRTAVERAGADERVGVVVITGAGRGFCSGADLSAVDPEQADGDETVRGMDDHFNPTMRAIKACQVPTIARVNGAAAGGGLGLALACDVAIAARSAFFVATFGPRLGIVPDLGSTWSLPVRAGHARAMGMAMLGDRIPAERAADWGLIWKCVDDERLDEEVAASAEVLKRTSGEAMQRIRSSIDTAPNRTFSEQLDLERDHQRVLIPMNMSEGASAFMAKREPDFKT